MSEEMMTISSLNLHENDETKRKNSHPIRNQSNGKA